MNHAFFTKFTFTFIFLALSTLLFLSFYNAYFPINVRPFGFRVVEETEFPNESTDPQFWLDSGALFFTNNKEIFTIQGSLPFFSKWHKLYAINKPESTSDGAKPQNILRIITKQTYTNVTQEAYFNIKRYNALNSINDVSSNGILLFNNYINSDNLYYAGLRVDGTAVIKKKVAGTYTTLAQHPIAIDIPKQQQSSGIKLPLERWIGIKTTIISIGDMTTITLYTDLDNSGTWITTLTATDTPKSFTTDGSGGIRTDFMDVQIKDYQIVSE